MSDRDMESRKWKAMRFGSTVAPKQKMSSVCETTLLGPGSDETEKDGEEPENVCVREGARSQYPYVVLEMAKSEKPVIFK